MSQFVIKSIMNHEIWKGEAGSIREAVEAAARSGADLQSADLRSADLRYADLRFANLQSANLQSANLRSADLQSANLRSADLQSADLRSANLRYADLQSADLRSANFRSADLRYADLQSANLRSADLRSADLQSADLRSADLRYADLRSADLRSADLRSVRDDFRAVLEVAPREVLGLRCALLLGNVDGSTYTGACACLVGTIANVSGVVHTSLVDLRPDAGRPAERWFLAIREGDNRRNNQVVAITLGWIDEWLAEKGIVVPKRPKVVGEVGRLMLQMTPGQRREMLREARARGPR